MESEISAELLMPYKKSKTSRLIKTMMHKGMRHEALMWSGLLTEFDT
jgi:hypothetical protein